MYTNILISTDGSELAGKAVRHGMALPESIGAKTAALTTLPPFHAVTMDAQMIEDTAVRCKGRVPEHAEKTFGADASAAHAAGDACYMVEHEHPYPAITDTAGSKECDLIVMASHGRRGICVVVLDSETAEERTHSMIPALVHR